MDQWSRKTSLITNQTRSLIRFRDTVEMKENITNRPNLEEARQEKLLKQHIHELKSEALNPEEQIDETPLPKGMREKVETVEVSTFKPKA